MPLRVVKVTDRDRTDYYFRRKPWPEVRIYGEPGSPVFEACYQSLLAASTAAEQAQHVHRALGIPLDELLQRDEANWRGG
jgi:hypothetical protein